MLVILIDSVVIGVELRKKKADVRELSELVKLIPRGVMEEEIPGKMVKGYVGIRDGEGR